MSRIQYRVLPVIISMFYKRDCNNSGDGATLYVTITTIVVFIPNSRTYYFSGEHVILYFISTHTHTHTRTPIEYNIIIITYYCSKRIARRLMLHGLSREAFPRRYYRLPRRKEQKKKNK